MVVVGRAVDLHRFAQCVDAKLTLMGADCMKPHLQRCGRRTAARAKNRILCAQMLQFLLQQVLLTWNSPVGICGILLYPQK